jgi:hypothetical protein
MAVPIRRLVLGIVGLAILAQVFPPSRSNPPVNAEREITTAMKVDPDALRVLDRSCNDCHSDRTVWPWYSQIAPVSWVVASDVSNGRRHMNFSEWGTYPDYKQKDLLSEMCKLVTDHGMPPFSYALTHRSARLTESDEQSICSWTKAVVEGTLTAE